jgi:uncharacterized membrane protein YcaP (DUF421 family)
MGPHLLSVWRDLVQLGSPDMTNDWAHWLEKLLRPAAVYLFLVFLLRRFGKRMLAQLNPFDFVVLLTLSNTVQNAIIGEDNSLIGGLIGAAVLVLVNSGLDHLTFRSSRLSWLLDGRPTVVVLDGLANHRALMRLGMTPEELDNAIQAQGADSLSQVRRVAVQPGGSVTVDLQPDARTATIGDLRRAVDALTARLEAQGGGSTPTRG